VTEHTVTEWIRNHIEHTHGLAPRATAADVAAHIRDRFDPQFMRLREARIGVGFLRYEMVRGRAPDYARRARAVLDHYDATGNREFLVDLANFAELEWVTPSREGTYFEAIDRKDGTPT